MYNQKSDLLSVDTTVVKSEDKGQQVVITDSNRNFYSFFKTKQDGSATAAANTFALSHNGQPVTIVFKEVPYKGKTLRNVVKFSVQDGNRPSPQEPPRHNAPSSSNVPVGQDTLGKRLAIHGFVNGLLAAGAAPSAVTESVLTDLDSLETRVTNFLERGGNNFQPNNSTDGEIQVEDIPF